MLSQIIENNYLEKSNSEQKQAIMHGDGPAMILAGPGSGKTFVITNRIHYLINHKHIPPERIAVITFTKAAATEMQQRAVHITPNASGVAFGTFHSIFYQILRSDYEYQDYSILGETEKYSILKQILYTKFNKENEISGRIPILKSQISYYLNTGILTEEDFFDNATFYDLLRLYQLECLRRKKVDFDMILTECLKLLEKKTGVREKWQNYFRYYLIDEFQDSSEIQYKVIKILAQKHQNLFIVGDDDQSIYSFRGASPSIMFQFLRNYPGAKQIILNKNYRNSEEILNLAVHSIGNNSLRFEKQLLSQNPKEGHVILGEADSVEDEVNRLIEEILKCQKSGILLKDMAILCRTNAKFSYLRTKLEKQKIACEHSVTGYNLYEEEPVKDIFCYLKFVFGKKERKFLLPVLNKPERFLSSIYFETETVDFDGIINKYRRKWGNNELYINLLKLKNHMEFLGKLDPYGCVCYILYVMGYENFYLNSIALSEDKKDRTKEIFEELKLYAKEYDNVNVWIREVDSKNINIVQNPQVTGDKMSKETNSTRNGIKLYTYHGSKGLEFSHVFMPFVNGYTVPHKKAVTKEQIEEERRMFYVAMTRAKEYLYISYIKETAAKPSIFINELKTAERKAVQDYSTSSTSSSNSELSRYSSNASATISYSSSSSIYSSEGSAFGSLSSSK